MSEESQSIIRESEKLKLDNERWKNRRGMAWKAFYLACTLTVVLFLAALGLWFTGDTETINAASEWSVILVGALGGLWSVVAAYIGSAAYSDVRLLKKEE